MMVHDRLKDTRERLQTTTYETVKRDQPGFLSH